MPANQIDVLGHKHEILFLHPVMSLTQSGAHGGPLGAEPQGDWDPLTSVGKLPGRETSMFLGYWGRLQQLPGRAEPLTKSKTQPAHPEALSYNRTLSRAKDATFIHLPASAKGDVQTGDFLNWL